MVSYDVGRWYKVRVDYTREKKKLRNGNYQRGNKEKKDVARGRNLFVRDLGR